MVPDFRMIYNDNKIKFIYFFCGLNQENSMRRTYRRDCGETEYFQP